ncbi:Putative diguanylate cyclase (GGDEF domain) [Gloeomargarita lithophora Alchichica-D10]|uniref:Diguanylate cyclase (GGDEF domain) n=2 Tax=Gloeomargarita TaxID=1188227 RepID=A0A1J0ABY5_9CYAN|nr:Putative diguanylate cyclase (GGDEF domain) [Gloeomargarita lithophora Alchichica-D10]
MVMNWLIIGISLAFLYVSRPLSPIKFSRRWVLHRWYCVFITIIFNGFFYLQWQRLGHNSAYFIIQFIYAVLWFYPDRLGVWFYGVNFVYYMLVISTGHAQGLVRLSGYFTGFSILSITWISEQIILDLRLRDFQLRKTVDEQAQELQKVNRELNQIAFQDSLTGLANRRALDDFLSIAWTRGATTQMPLALLLCDVDYFKRYNDGYGHPAGDQCLRDIAQILRQTIPEPDFCIARYGGEEFALVLPATSDSGAQAVAQNLLENVRRAALPHAYALTGDYVSISIGISSTIPQPDHSPKALILSADLALYQAKSQGRNRAVYQGMSPSLPPAVA